MVSGDVILDAGQPIRFCEGGVEVWGEKLLCPNEGGWLVYVAPNKKIFFSLDNHGDVPILRLIRTENLPRISFSVKSLQM